MEKKLSTTEETIITTDEKEEIVNQTPEKQKNICCPDILNLIVNIYPISNNKECRKKTAANPGSKILWCHGCKRSMLLKNCSVVANASFQREKEITNKM